MGTEAIADTLKPAIPKYHPPLRFLWQIPLFIVGLVTLAGVFAFRNGWHINNDAGIEQDLSKARTLLAGPDWDLDQIGILTADSIKQADKNPQLAGEASFLLGSAYLQAADKQAGEAARQFLTLARYNLERAEGFGVSGADQTKLSYR